ncbi:MAG TPA: hypothetical protein PK199_07535 [Bacteroidales bacterium]|nr:hypothetical protein [Bacteroidales bacterium]
MKKIFLIIQRIVVTLILLIVVIACNKVDVPQGTPSCIRKKIKEDNIHNCLDSVYRYNYLGKDVYLFVYPCPEGCYSLIDEHCNSILDSTGVAMCSCSWGGAFCNNDFIEKRSHKQLIWSK